MTARDPAGVVGHAGGDIGDPQRGGVRRQYGVFGYVLDDCLEHRVFSIQVLRDGFEYDIGLGHAVGEVDREHDFVYYSGRRGVRKPLAVEKRDGALDPVSGRFEVRLVVVDQRHVLATERELYAEPVPHLSRADHRDGVSCHRERFPGCGLYIGYGPRWSCLL